MNDKLTISTFELFKMFPDQESARLYLEKRLWPNGCRCPVCGIGDRVTARKNGFYRCNQCKEDFTVRKDFCYVDSINWDELSAELDEEDDHDL